MRRTVSLMLVAATISVGCSTVTPGDDGPTASRGTDLDCLARWMTGTFSSHAQAERDPANFFDIRLVMVPIHGELGDGHWFYVEQAAATALERPYRQRVYHLHRGEGGVIRSDVYTFEREPLAYAGVWRRPDELARITLDDLALRDGCSIFFEPRVATRFIGETVGADCLSTLGGASYASSEVEVSEQWLTSWDRGFDAENQQVWGATEGPYRFECLSRQPPA